MYYTHVGASVYSYLFMLYPLNLLCAIHTGKIKIYNLNADILVWYPLIEIPNEIFG